MVGGSAIVWFARQLFPPVEFDESVIMDWTVTRARGRGRGTGHRHHRPDRAHCLRERPIWRVVSRLSHAGRDRCFDPATRNGLPKPGGEPGGMAMPSSAMSSMRTCISTWSAAHGARRRLPALAFPDRSAGQYFGRLSAHHRRERRALSFPRAGIMCAMIGGEGRLRAANPAFILRATGRSDTQYRRARPRQFHACR